MTTRIEAGLAETPRLVQGGASGTGVASGIARVRLEPLLGARQDRSQCVAPLSPLEFQALAVTTCWYLVFHKPLWLGFQVTEIKGGEELMAMASAISCSC
jgi:hypothetical protein